MRMENRQCMYKAVAPIEAPVFPQRGRVRQEIVMRQHGALRTARRAGRIEDRRQVVGSARYILELPGFALRHVEKRSAAAIVQRLDEGAISTGNGCKRFLRGRTAHDQTRLRITDEILEVGKRIGERK